MEINSYVGNHDACERRNTLIEISMTRVLTEAERIELDILVSAISDFEERILNFD